MFVCFQNGLCQYDKSSLVAKVSSYTNVTSGDVLALKAALFKFGPVAVSIDAAHRSFAFYSNGVYYEPACSESTHITIYHKTYLFPCIQHAAL